MRADLITLCVGMNDMTRPGRGFDQALAQLDELHARLAELRGDRGDDDVPRPGQDPADRPHPRQAGRLRSTSGSATPRSATGSVWSISITAASMTQPDTWSRDRVHGSTKGHMLFAAAAAEALGLPGSSHDWARADRRRSSRR